LVYFLSGLSECTEKANQSMTGWPAGCNNSHNGEKSNDLDIQWQPSNEGETN